MHLGIFVYATGHHIAGWRRPDAEAGGENFDLIRRIAQRAEAAKFDMLFLADGQSTKPNDHPAIVVRLEPYTLLSALAACTDRLGLAGTATTTYYEPYNLARIVGSLDHISGGRAAWNVVTGGGVAGAMNFNIAKLPPHDERYEMALEFVEVVKGLWDSWEDGAVPMDKASGLYADGSRLHDLNHEGKYYKVKGPLNMSRPPQGYPVIIQAGASEQGRNVAATIGEVLYTVEQNLDSAVAFAQDIRRRAVEKGRDPATIKIMPGVCPIVGRTTDEAQARWAELSALADNSAEAMEVLSARLGTDMSTYPLDEPLPDLPPSQTMRGHYDALTRLARDEKMTLRDLRDFVANALGHRVICGDPETIADGLQEWLEAGACDGFNLMPPWFPGAFDDFCDLVVPVLQRRGLFRTEYSGRTLRDHLGLARPPHPAAAALEAAQ